MPWQPSPNSEEELARRAHTPEDEFIDADVFLAALDESNQPSRYSQRGRKPPVARSTRNGPAKDLRGYGLDDPRFRPTLRKLLDDLKCDPLSFPKKRGKLKDARAASLRFSNVTWRLVFTIDELRRLVRVLAVAPHDTAYERASRRI